jgi:uncharacterized Zn-binding protein involved in type VI secretion
LAIAAYAATLVCSGGTAAFLMPIAPGLLASALPALGQYFGKKFSSPPGEIQLPGCSTDVYVNNRNAAHVELSLGRCEKHPAPVQVAEGSSNVFINSVAAARKDDRLTCGARISGGSDDVFIGGSTVDDEIPGWLRVVVDVLMIVASMGKALVSVAKRG